MPQADPLARDAQLLSHRFRLERLLGRGGCGEVHAAFDLLTQRRVAVKLLRPDGSDPEFEEALRSEFRVLRALSHPGIVQVFDFGRDEAQVPFYTMELLDGVDLGAAASNADPHQLLEQVARALDYLHANGLVHSDLKPSNVFLVGSPLRFKLTDFGLVRRMRGRRRDAPYGTLAYMPPERLRGGEAAPDAREDLYALGALLFEVLARRPPYAASTGEATLANILGADLERELESVPEAWARLLRRLLAADPAQRFASAWELLQAWNQQFDRALPAPQAWGASFVGRRRELAQVRAALADLGRGRGALFHVSGPPGVGKTALLDVAVAQAAAFGLPCWRIETGASPRPLALVESLAALYERWQPGLPEELREAAGHLADWPRALHAAGDDLEQLNVNAHALADLRSVARAAPHVLVLDDAQRLDHASRDLVIFMAAHAAELGIVLLLAGRAAAGACGTASEAPDTLARDLQRARRIGAAVHLLPLRELVRDDVMALVRRRLGDDPEIELLGQRIFDLTQGHPFFVTEALQHLVATGQLRREKAGWFVAPHTERKLLPRLADTILSEHIAALRPEDRGVFELLALLPSGGTPATLAPVLGEREEAAREALERGVHVGLLQPGRDPGSYRFAHEVIREACAVRVPDAAARRWHRQIADAAAGTPVEAHHRLCAGESTPQARDCFLREARGLEVKRAPWEALRFYEAALEISPQSPDANELALRVAELRLQVGLAEPAAQLLLQRLVGIHEPLLRARSLHLLGEACARQGRNDEALFHMQAAAELFRAHADAHEQRRFTAQFAGLLLAKGDYAAAIAACTRALGETPAPDEPRGRSGLLLLQAQAQRQGGDYDGAESTCREALEVLKPLGRTLELAQTYTQIGMNYYYRRDFEQAERFCRAALKVHTELGDLHGMKNAFNNLGMAQMRAEKLEEATRSYEQSLELNRRLGDRQREGGSLNNLGNLWERRGDHRRAFQCYRRGVGLYRRLDRPRELATLYNNMGEVQVRLGRFRSAQRLLHRAEEYAARVPGSYIAQVVALNLALTHLAFLEHEAAAAVLNQALQQVRRSGLANLASQFHALLALAYARAGDAAQAALHERQALEDLPRQLEDEARLEALLALAEASAHLGQHATSGTRAQEAAELATRSSRPYARARAQRLVALAAGRQGDWDVAEAQLEDAVSQCRAQGFRYELAKCYKSLGFLHWDIGLRARAEEDFQRCLDALQELGLRAELGLTYLELARLVPEDDGDGRAGRAEPK